MRTKNEYFIICTKWYSFEKKMPSDDNCIIIWRVLPNGDEEIITDWVVSEGVLYDNDWNEQPILPLDLWTYYPAPRELYKLKYVKLVDYFMSPDKDVLA